MPETPQEVVIVKRIQPEKWGARKAAGATDVYNGAAVPSCLQVIAFSTADLTRKPDGFNNPDIQIIRDPKTVAALRANFAKLFRDQGLQG